MFSLSIVSVQCSLQESDNRNTGTHADVLSVDTSASGDEYKFTVRVSSPDTGCGQYADWWEIVSKAGMLLKRKILTHSHVNEQPFTRSTGSFSIDPKQEVWVRAHMNTTGYGGTVFFGSIQDGFVEAEPDSNFAADLEESSPQPEGCRF